MAKHNAESLKMHCTSHYELQVSWLKKGKEWQVQEVLAKAQQLLTNFTKLDSDQLSSELRLRIPYDQQLDKCLEFFQWLQMLREEQQNFTLSVQSENLEEHFSQLTNSTSDNVLNLNNDNGHLPNIESEISVDFKAKPLNCYRAWRLLLWKRFLHFTRNYRLILAAIVLPVLFEICAMWFVAQRPDDDYDKTIRLSRNLYPNTMQFLSREVNLSSPLHTPLTYNLHHNLIEECNSQEFTCQNFDNVSEAFQWILETESDYREQRYGGYSLNSSRSTVWYNNKGYHAMVSWLNDLNTHLLQSELNLSDYSIITYNEPWKLDIAEFSTTSM